MFQSWRLKLREAEEAVKGQRLDEARDLLNQHGLREFLPAKRLAAKLATELALRGQLRAGRGESAAGWSDLEAAADLGCGPELVSSLRQTLIEQAVAEAEGYLQAGEARAAIQRLDSLELRSEVNRDVRQLKQAALKFDSALRLAAAGDFSQAEAALEAAKALRPDIQSFAERQEALRQSHAEARRLREQLHTLLSQQRWTEVVQVAEQLLDLAPRDDMARDARRRAWQAAGARVDAKPRYAAPAAAARTGMANTISRPSLTSAPASEAGARFLLWVDGVGGYLVCESEEVRLGQPVPEHQVEVPIVGDLSHNHAVIRRAGEGFLITPRRPTKVNGREIRQATSLADGAMIELGEGVRLRFRKPHPLSGTARLEVVSQHRTQPPVDAVLLMADSCVLGPGRACHVVCRELQGDVVLFRHNGQLFCRAGPVSSGWNLARGKLSHLAQLAIGGRRDFDETRGTGIAGELRRFDDAGFFGLARYETDVSTPR